MKQLKAILGSVGVALVLSTTVACNNNETNTTAKAEQIDAAKVVVDTTRIVSTSGTTTEILCALGLEKNIVGVDVTSTYPESMKPLPKTGHGRDISTEAVAALKPQLVVGSEEQLNANLQQTFTAAGMKAWALPVGYTVDAACANILRMADSFGKRGIADSICKVIRADIAAVTKPAKVRKVLFVYARGTGMMMVAGAKTSVSAMIELAGAKNAIDGFENFKPLTPEAVATANPDVILMFTDGLQSLGGIEGLLKVQGVSATNAGKHKSVIEMDGQFLTGFGPRLGKAVQQLSTAIQNAP